MREGNVRKSFEPGDFPEAPDSLLSGASGICFSCVFEQELCNSVFEFRIKFVRDTVWNPDSVRVSVFIFIIKTGFSRGAVFLNCFQKTLGGSNGNNVVMVFMRAENCRACGRQICCRGDFRKIFFRGRVSEQNLVVHGIDGKVRFNVRNAGNGNDSGGRRSPVIRAR